MDTKKIIYWTDSMEIFKKKADDNNNYLIWGDFYDNTVNETTEFKKYNNPNGYILMSVNSARNSLPIILLTNSEKNIVIYSSLAFINELAEQLTDKNFDFVKIEEDLEGLSGGRMKKQQKLSKSNEKIKIGNQTRVIYLGTRGGRYVKMGGNVVPVSKLNKK